jgi:GNAT superfamily N-acetyltransferase
MTLLATIEELAPEALDAALPELAEVLHASVHAGASIGFLLPFPLAEAQAYWCGVRPSLVAGERLMLVARLDRRIIGTASLLLGGLPNGRHRAEVAKVMVHPDARRRGIAAALMRGIEDAARRHGRSLLLLDTTTGRAAEQLYLGLGYRRVAVLEGYALDPDGTMGPTTLLRKDLTDA